MTLAAADEEPAENRRARVGGVGHRQSVPHHSISRILGSWPSNHGHEKTQSRVRPACCCVIAILVPKARFELARGRPQPILSRPRLPVPPLRPLPQRSARHGARRVPPRLDSKTRRMEATTGFEPVNRGFADLPLNHLGTSPRSVAGRPASHGPVVSLDHWCVDVGCPSRIRTSVHGSKVRCPTTRRRGSGFALESAVAAPAVAPPATRARGARTKKWSGRRDSNPRPSPWQGDALPTEPLPPDCDHLSWWCREPESNWRHRDFQSRALPTELSRPDRPALAARRRPGEYHGPDRPLNTPRSGDMRRRPS